MKLSIIASTVFLIIWLVSALYLPATQAAPPPDVPPQIDDLADLGGRSPVEFLEILKEKKFNQYTIKPIKNWISKKDVLSLLALINSKDACSPVASYYSSYYNTQKSTVGQEALFMLEGFRKGEYPPALNSGISDAGKEALVRWCREQIR